MSEATKHSTQIFLDSKAQIIFSIAFFLKCIPWGIHWCPRKGGEAQIIFSIAFFPEVYSMGRPLVSQKGWRQGMLVNRYFGKH